MNGPRRRTSAGNPAPLPEDRILAFRRRLLRWYREHRRDLPWRRTADPYAIWLSEVMLQQTQIATVIPYWNRFLERFPTVEALAAASEDQVLACWTGLGYYSRARNLLRAARAVATLHGGRLPASYPELAALPGVGPYTAAAVASIAFGLPHAVLDGNVARVLCRLEALPGDDRTPGARARLQALAGELLAPRAPSDFNQAMMELGALLCTPRAPDCPACPVSELCKAREAGEPARYPERERRAKSVEVDWTVAVARLGPRVLLVRSVSARLFKGLWELPWVEQAPAAAGPALAEKYGLALTLGCEFRTLRHSVTTRRILLHAVEASVGDDRLRENAAGGRWTTLEELRETGVSSIATKLLAGLPPL